MVTTLKRTIKSMYRKLCLWFEWLISICGVGTVTPPSGCKANFSTEEWHKSLLSALQKTRIIEEKKISISILETVMIAEVF